MRVLDSISKNKKDTLKSLLSLLLIFAIIISVFGFYRDFRNTIKYGGMDLRNKVVGARLLLKGLDPYFYKWSPGDSDLLLDPIDIPDKPVSRQVVTPAYLMLHIPTAKLSYRIQRMMYLIFQWLLFLLSLLILVKNTNSGIKSKIIWILGLLFISGSPYWRLHVERGQKYIIFIFLISLAYWISKKNFKNSAILSGFFIGFLVSIRPPAVLIGIPILIYRKWKMLFGGIIGLVFGIASPLIVTDISIWKKYFASMQFWAGAPHSFNIKFGETYQSIYPDKIIEGMSNIGIGAKIETYDSSLQAIFTNYLGIKLSANILLITLSISILLVSIFLLSYRIKNISMSMLFLVGTMLIFISEYFIPAARFSYYNIIWLITLSLVIINYESISSLLNPLVIVLLIGLFFSISIPFAPRGMLISDATIIFYTVISTIFLLRKNWQKENRYLLKSSSY